MRAMPPAGRRWRVLDWDLPEPVPPAAPPDPANIGWQVAPDPNNPERVNFMHVCGFNGNTTRPNFPALRDRHMRERHTD